MNKKSWKNPAGRIEKAKLPGSRWSMQRYILTYSKLNDWILNSSEFPAEETSIFFASAVPHHRGSGGRLVRTSKPYSRHNMNLNHHCNVTVLLWIMKQVRVGLSWIQVLLCQEDRSCQKRPVMQLSLRSTSHRSCTLWSCQKDESIRDNQMWSWTDAEALVFHWFFR